MADVFDFIRQLQWHELPTQVQATVRRCVLDTFGIAVSGVNTKMAGIARQLAVSQFAASNESACGLLGYDARTSATGAAMAGGFLVDSVDGHDGHRLTKGHAGATVLPALCAMAGDMHRAGQRVSGKEFLACATIGYEVALRSGIALHRSSTEYHTSGAWACIGVAAMGARLFQFSEQRTAEAFGIADYHGPRSPMMRCIDHPTMLKDGAGWGAMSGTAAVYLARLGFTGAPAQTVTAADEQDYFDRYETTGQYLKLWPVCRWGQPAMQAAHLIWTAHRPEPTKIKSVTIETFHQAVRLGNRLPVTEEQAQYSIGFPVASMLACGSCSVSEITGDALFNPLTRSIQQKISLLDKPEYSTLFPDKRIASVTVEMNDGSRYQQRNIEAPGDYDAPLSDAQVIRKFHDFTSTVLTRDKAQRLLDTIDNLENLDDSMDLLALICGTDLRL